MSIHTIDNKGYVLTFSVSKTKNDNITYVEVTVPIKNKKDRNIYWSTSEIKKLILENISISGDAQENYDSLHYASNNEVRKFTLSFKEERSKVNVTSNIENFVSKTKTNRSSRPSSAAKKHKK